MKRILPLIFSILLLLSGCSGNTSANGSYEQISQQEAKTMMDTQDVIILDVREQEEYDPASRNAGYRLPR